jgi:hypothetical protein
MFIGEDYQEIFVFAGLGLCSGVASSIVQSRVPKARESSSAEHVQRSSR